MNPFSGIISTKLKTLYNNAISALLYDESLTVPCTIYYGITKYEDCANCVYDSIGQKSANRYQAGGPAPFPFGTICPMCNGRGKRGVETTDTLNMMIIWDSTQFMPVGTVNKNEGMIQTITFESNTPKLKRAKEILVENRKEGYLKNRYERDGEPEPCGLLPTNFVSCIWKRVG